jgi:two-component system cell cycle response regulator
MTKMRLLVVDDDALLRRSLNLQLTRAGYEVHEAEDGQVAWDMIQREVYRFVITDWNMPGVNGPELVRRIRAMLSAGYTYIVLLTAHSDRLDVVAGLKSGADDYLTKPFDMDELRARVTIGARILDLEFRLQESLASAAERAVRDGLTGLFNRREFDSRLADEVQRAARYGGEEFAVILPETNPANAQAVASSILERVCAHPFLYRETQPGAALTVSIGVAARDDGHPDAERLLLAADRALYQAKRDGRNRVVVT